MIAEVLNKYLPGKQWTLDGDSYEGLNWLDESPKPSLEQINNWIGSYVYVPLSITPRQARLILNQYNLREQVETAIANADQNTKDEWEFATEIKRNWESLNLIASSIGITSEQLDQMFIEASVL